MRLRPAVLRLPLVTHVYVYALPVYRLVRSLHYGVYVTGYLRTVTRTVTHFCHLRCLPTHAYTFGSCYAVHAVRLFYVVRLRFYPFLQFCLPTGSARSVPSCRSFYRFVYPTVCYARLLRFVVTRCYACTGSAAVPHGYVPLRLFTPGWFATHGYRLRLLRFYITTRSHVAVRTRWFAVTFAAFALPVGFFACVLVYTPRLVPVTYTWLRGLPFTAAARYAPLPTFVHTPLTWFAVLPGYLPTRLLLPFFTVGYYTHLLRAAFCGLRLLHGYLPGYTVTWFGSAGYYRTTPFGYLVAHAVTQFTYTRGSGYGSAAFYRLRLVLRALCTPLRFHTTRFWLRITARAFCLPHHPISHGSSWFTLLVYTLVYGCTQRHLPVRLHTGSTVTATAAFCHVCAVLVTVVRYHLLRTRTFTLPGYVCHCPVHTDVLQFRTALPVYLRLRVHPVICYFFTVTHVVHTTVLPACVPGFAFGLLCRFLRLRYRTILHWVLQFTRWLLRCRTHLCHHTPFTYRLYHRLVVGSATATALPAAPLRCRAYLPAVTHITAFYRLLGLVPVGCHLLVTDLPTLPTPGCLHTATVVRCTVPYLPPALRFTTLLPRCTFGSVHAFCSRITRCCTCHFHLRAARRLVVFCTRLVAWIATHGLVAYTHSCYLPYQLVLVLRSCVLYVTGSCYGSGSVLLHLPLHVPGCVIYTFCGCYTRFTAIFAFGYSCRFTPRSTRSCYTLRLVATRLQLPGLRTLRIWLRFMHTTPRLPHVLPLHTPVRIPLCGLFTLTCHWFCRFFAGLPRVCVPLV